jgi:hypothetical protein
VLVIDVEPSHCQKVMRAVAEGARSVPSAPTVEIIGRSLGEDNATLATLYEYMTLLLQGASIGGNILAVNMSVDWGVACDHGQPLANEISTVSVSFPFFEHVLARVRRHLTESSGRAVTRIPAFFAAAGNQRGGVTRWRMAYPAVRPDVLAATFVAPLPAAPANDGARLAPHVDCPAVFDVKPCFGVNRDSLPEDLRNGSSFACAWLAGHYAALATKDSDGQLQAASLFSKTATLQSSGTVCSVVTATRYWARPSVSVFTGSRTIRSHNSLAEMLTQLNQLDVDVEFVVTGSVAMADVVLSKAGRDWDALRDVSRVLGDIDVIQSAPLPPDKQANAAQLVSEWLASGPGVPGARLDLCLLEQRVSAPMLAQRIVPASQLLITAAGVVDATGGQRDIEGRRLRIHIPDSRRVWDLNPQFLSASAGMALGILVWIDLSLVLQIVSHALGLDSRCPLEQESVNAARAALTATANDLDAQQRTFGMNPGAGEERLGRRMERAHMLLRAAKRCQLNVSVQQELVRLLEDAPVPA